MSHWKRISLEMICEIITRIFQGKEMKVSESQEVDSQRDINARKAFNVH